MIRVAAVADVHLAPDLAGSHRDALQDLPSQADLLLIAGDLTQHGTIEEAEVVAKEYVDLGVPVVAVLGNHDFHSNQEEEIRNLLTSAGLVVLENETYVAEINGCTVGIAGAKGFGLGFSGRSASDFGEPEMKAFTRKGRESASQFSEALLDLGTDIRIALTHYAPVDDTLVGEPPEIWPFLGNYLLGEAIDTAGVDLALHGHAHAGVEKGLTDGGVRVRNVARPVIRRPYVSYVVEPSHVALERSG